MQLGVYVCDHEYALNWNENEIKRLNCCNQSFSLLPLIKLDREN